MIRIMPPIFHSHFCQGDHVQFGFDCTVVLEKLFKSHVLLLLNCSSGKPLSKVMNLSGEKTAKKMVLEIFFKQLFFLADA